MFNGLVILTLLTQYITILFIRYKCMSSIITAFAIENAMVFQRYAPHIIGRSSKTLMYTSFFSAIISSLYLHSFTTITFKNAFKIFKLLIIGQTSKRTWQFNLKVNINYMVQHNEASI